MTTISITLTQDLIHRLDDAARRRQVDREELVRELITEFAHHSVRAADPGNDADADPASHGEEIEVVPGSFLDRAKDIIGSVDAPADILTNPRYMEGYGR